MSADLLPIRKKEKKVHPFTAPDAALVEAAETAHEALAAKGYTVSLGRRGGANSVVVRGVTSKARPLIEGIANRAVAPLWCASMTVGTFLTLTVKSGAREHGEDEVQPIGTNDYTEGAA